MPEKTQKRDFISDAGKFLQELEQRPETTSPARSAEEEKYTRINRLRDDPNAKADGKKIWKGF